MATDAWDRFREAVQVEDWTAALPAALEVLNATDEEIWLIRLLDTMQERQVVEAFCGQAVGNADEAGLLDLRAALGADAPLSSMLERFARALQLPGWRMCVSCALAAYYAGRKLSGNVRNALWEASHAVVGNALPDASPSVDVRAMFDGLDGVALVQRICAEMYDLLDGRRLGRVAAQILHLTREFMGEVFEDAEGLRLTGLYVTGGDYDTRGRVCWVNCRQVRGGFREVVPRATRTPPLSDKYLGGLITARDYLRSLRDSSNGSQLWASDTDLCIALAPKYEEHFIRQVDGRSMTALIAALGENALCGGPPVDLSCSVSADLADGDWTLAPVGGIREKVFAAYQAGLRALIVCQKDEEKAVIAAHDAHAQRRADYEQGLASSAPSALHITPCNTVEQVCTVLTREPQALLSYLDALSKEMVQRIPPLFIPEHWRARFYEDLYQPLQVRFMVRKEIPQPPGPDGRPQSPRVELVEERRFWDDYHRELIDEGTRRFEILADGGQGKTTLLQFTTWKLATEAARAIRGHQMAARNVRVPFFFRCDALEGDGPLEHAMVQSLCHSYRLDTQGRELLGEMLASKRAVICWDAMDETTEAVALAAKIADFARKYPGPEIYLTCRTKQLPQIAWPTSNPVGSGDHKKTIELAPFDPESIGQFAMAWARMLQETMA